MFLFKDKCLLCTNVCFEQHMYLRFESLFEEAIANLSVVDFHRLLALS